MTHGMGLRENRFGDITYYRNRKGRRPSKVVLIAPHTNEHPAVLPFQAALARKLMAEGITTEEKAVYDMMERGWAVRKGVGKTYPRTNDVISAVLMLEDYAIRARLVYDAIKKGDRETIVVEMHGQTRTFNDEDYFGNPHIWRRLRGTTILIAAKAMPDHLGFLDMENNAHHETIKDRELAEKAEEIAKLRNFDLMELIKELEELGRELRRYTKSLKLVELPTKDVKLPKEHPMHDTYYDQEGRGFLTSAFEDMYCTVTRENPGFSERDVEKVASIIAF